MPPLFGIYVGERSGIWQEMRKGFYSVLITVIKLPKNNRDPRLNKSFFCAAAGIRVQLVVDISGKL